MWTIHCTLVIVVNYTLYTSNSCELYTYSNSSLWLTVRKKKENKILAIWHDPPLVQITLLKKWNNFCFRHEQRPCCWYFRYPWPYQTALSATWCPPWTQCPAGRRTGSYWRRWRVHSWQPTGLFPWIHILIFWLEFYPWKPIFGMPNFQW